MLCSSVLEGTFVAVVPGGSTVCHIAEKTDFPLAVIITLLPDSTRLINVYPERIIGAKSSVTTRTIFIRAFSDVTLEIDVIPPVTIAIPEFVVG